LRVRVIAGAATGRSIATASLRWRPAAANPTIMGTLAIRSRLRNLGGAATVLMGITVVAMFATM
jgi:hypothetical protein